MTTSSAPRLHERPPIIAALLAGEGSAADGYLDVLCRRQVLLRDLADAVHLLCALHGRQPGVVDHALARAADAPAWLVAGAEAFARERAYLARLVSAAGPIPSTPGQAECEAAVAAQRHAFDTLAQSEREGCMLGAAATVLLDWHAARPVLDAAAERFGVSPAADTLPDADAILTALPQGPAAERALGFAAQQVLAQHRGLWRLLESRAAARLGA